MWKAHKDRQLRLFWKEGLSDGEISEKMNYSYRLVSYHREKMGLPKNRLRDSNAPEHYEVSTPTYRDKINPLWLGQAYIGLDPATMCIHENGGVEKLTLDEVVKRVNSKLKEHGLRQLSQFPECFV